MRASSYLELNWLAKSDKDILLPPVIFADIPYSGCLYFPEKKEILLSDKYYPLDKGLILIKEASPGDEIEAAIAHEWRHVWQYYQGDKLNIEWENKPSLSHQEQIIDFFISNPAEYDAFLFELKKSPCDSNKEWYEWIIKR